MMLGMHGRFIQAGVGDEKCINLQIFVHLWMDRRFLVGLRSQLFTDPTAWTASNNDRREYDDTCSHRIITRRATATNTKLTEMAPFHQRRHRRHARLLSQSRPLRTSHWRTPPPTAFQSLNSTSIPPPVSYLSTDLENIICYFSFSLRLTRV